MVSQIIGHNNFRPMNHRCFNELQGMFAQAQLIAFLNRQVIIRIGVTIELFKKFKRLGLADNFDVRIFFDQGQG